MTTAQKSDQTNANCSVEEVEMKAPVVDEGNENPTGSVSVPEPPPDPFDPENLRLSQDFVSSVGVKKRLVTIRVRKPDRQSFFRVHPGEAYRINTVLMKSNEERELYVVSRDLWSEVPGEVVPKVLFTTITRQGAVLLWPISLPKEDGRHDDWSRSALEAAQLAQSKWIRIASNMDLGAYDVFEATGDIPEPVWPDMEFRELLNIAFKDNRIESLDHPVLRRLRGEV